MLNPVLPASLKSYLTSPADLPTDELSTKRIKLLAGEEERVEKSEEEKKTEEIVWPDPTKRISPPVRTAVVLPEGVTCPEGCQCFCSSQDRSRKRV